MHRGYVKSPYKFRCISSKRGRRDEPSLEEWRLILNRVGVFGNLVDEAFDKKIICPKHRRMLTIDWPGRKSSTCTYPSHAGTRKQMKNYRRVNFVMSEEIFDRFQTSVPIGSGKSNLLLSLVFTGA